MSRFWRHLVALWGAAIVLAVALLALDGWLLHRQKVFWLLPYPSDVRAVWVTLATMFRDRPLLVTAMAVIPTIAVVGTLILVVSRAAATLARGRPRG